MTIKNIFTLKTNDDARRFEFTPIVDGFTSYTVSFDEVEADAEKAWLAVSKSVNDQKRDPA